jgi:ABC-2 type transport system permease protein
MKPSFLRLIVWEGRHLARSSAAWIVCAGLFVAGLLAVADGGRRLEEHRRAVAALPGHYATQMEGIARQFTPDGEAGYVAYYAFFPTHHPMPALTALATGVRDVAPDVVWVRMLGLEAQIHEAGLGNPAVQALGGFDLAFVICALMPLGLLILTHDVLTRERQRGRMALVVSQAGSLARLTVARIAVPAFVLGGVVTAVFAVACVWLQIAPDLAAARWLGAAWAYLVCWAAVAAAVAVWTRTVAGSLAVALSVWIGTAILAPALLNLAVTTAFPVTEGLELTVTQRQQIHGAWDRPRAEVLEEFTAKYPEWGHIAPVTGRFAWRWYYAMQQLGDDSVAEASQAHRRNLRARQELMTRLAWIAPPAYAQRLLSARAGSDLDAHLGYLERVRAFHAELRRYFYPLCIDDRTITPAQYASFPQFSAAAADKRADEGSGPGVLPLLVFAVLAAGAAGWRLRESNELIY